MRPSIRTVLLARPLLCFSSAAWAQGVLDGGPDTVSAVGGGASIPIVGVGDINEDGFDDFAVGASSGGATDG